MAFPPRVPERERAASGSHGILKRAVYQSVKCFCCLCSVTCVKRTGTHRVCVHGGRGRGATKMLRACAELCGANWHEEGTYAKSHSTWPLNLHKLSISCTRGACFLHAPVKRLKNRSQVEPIWKRRRLMFCPDGCHAAADTTD